ncbi:hypothetical protein H5410_025920 [Solanum commersonii]|uniref:Uncharacterized protein n=1 Tax=Solanum commersonii TaxID=4109 RepID=A0A9J5YZA9_SOLCO|nr:hypothetical protein H5410_025920 [Solanum commersonii]
MDHIHYLAHKGKNTLLVPPQTQPINFIRNGGSHPVSCVIRMLPRLKVLAGQELAHLEDESSGNEDAEMDVVGVASMLDKMREARLRLLGHVKRRCTNTLVKKCEQLAMVGLRIGRVRPKKYWRKVIRQDMTHLQLTRCTKLVYYTQSYPAFLEVISTARTHYLLITSQPR